MKASLLAAVVLACAVHCMAESDLPWEKDFPTALAKAKSSHQPLFLMLTATWCGPCKMLEAQTLTATATRSGLKDFIWVKAYEDQKLNERFKAGGYPTLVFLDSSGDHVLEKTVGFEPPESFLRHVIAARTAGNLPLTSEMKTLLAKEFKPDQTRIAALIKQGNAADLVNYLAPVKEDNLRSGNYLVVEVHLPSDTDPADVTLHVYGDYTVPASGLILAWTSRDSESVPVSISAPGFKTTTKDVPTDPRAAIAECEISLEHLSDRDAASFSGRVLRSDGHPLPNAIIRIFNWNVSRADDQGRFHIAPISPGEFTVRGEAPGGEFQGTINFTNGQELKQDLTLKPVTTVGVRWTLQRQEGLLDLTGEGLRSGEAYFSVDHSRFLLSRGAEVPEAYGSDFMLMADWQGVRQFISAEKIAALGKVAPGTPIFWLFDAGPHPNGLHLESVRFEDVRSVNDGKPTDKEFFKFLRGEAVCKGQVFTVRCVRKDCYAKMEVTDVTIVPAKQRTMAGSVK